VSMEVGYYRRWLQNYTVTDNINQNPSNFGTFTINAPVDPRLPGAGGYAIPGPLYNVNQDVAPNLTSLVTKAGNYGDQTQYSHSIALNLTARPRNGLILQGGFNTAKTVLDYCDIRAALPEMLIIIGTPTMSPTNPYCHQDTGFIKRFTALGSYTIPKVDVQIAGTVRSDQGDSLRADWQAPNSLISPILGRNLSNAVQSVTVNLIEPGTLYGDRVNELDLRIAKILRFGRTRTNVGVDFYNITNSAPVLTYNQAFVVNGPWLTPNSVLQSRFAKISAQIDF
jgi:hypothetical protein